MSSHTLAKMRLFTSFWGVVRTIVKGRRDGVNVGVKVRLRYQEMVISKQKNKTCKEIDAI